MLDCGPNLSTISSLC